MDLFQGMYKIRGVVQYYTWGGYEFIPKLLHIENKDHKPFAEYWLGAHPNHPSEIENDTRQSLIPFIQNDPELILGKEVVRKFSSLPYLFKILDVRQMLSIQVHPSKKSAQYEFQQENKKSIPLNAPHRN